MPNIEQWLAELDSLPPFPDRVSWTAGQVSALFAARANSEAPGLDGWTVAELRLLPVELFEWVAELFEAVERAG
eukprot:10041539-Alexandrium_andersonii.AAC.1